MVRFRVARLTYVTNDSREGEAGFLVSRIGPICAPLFFERHQDLG